MKAMAWRGVVSAEAMGHGSLGPGRKVGRIIIAVETPAADDGGVDGICRQFPVDTLRAGSGRIDAATFTAVRLLTGAAALALMMRRSEPPTNCDEARARFMAIQPLAGRLCGLLHPGVHADRRERGALVLFGCVQLTMIGAG